jgi:hypothetical protein
LTNSRPLDFAFGVQRSEATRCTTWYRRAKATECGGRGGRKSEHLIVPVKQGNGIRSDPGEGRRCQVMEPLEGNMAGAQEPGTVSTLPQRIAERISEPVT